MVKAYVLIAAALAAEGVMDAEAGLAGACAQLPRTQAQAYYLGAAYAWCSAASAFMSLS